MIVQVSHILRLPTPIVLGLFCFSCVSLFSGFGLRAQETCDVEVKILLLPTETAAAMAELDVKKQTAGRVYFFDTDTLELLSQGAIVRLRQGAHTDLTVKLRLPNGKKFSASSSGREYFKCEVDLTAESANSSYSISNRDRLEKLPESGFDVSHSLSPGQQELLTGAHISVDWPRVKRIAEIRTTTWQTRTQPHLGKLTLELWEWPGGKVLELSTKVSGDAGPTTFTELQQLVKTKHLSTNPNQLAKTSIALEAIVHASARH
jgi:hypothetical protein